MKVDSKEVAEFLNNSAALIEGIIETIRMGDDGLKDSIISQCEGIIKFQKDFAFDHLTEVIKQTNDMPNYVKELKELDYRYKMNENLSLSDMVTLFKGRLWNEYLAHVKVTDLTDIKSDELYSYLEEQVVQNSGLRIKCYSNDYYVSFHNTTLEFVEKIIKDRKSAPQSTLF